MAKAKVIPLPVRVEEEDDHECPRCPPVGAPAWMATFADMATLLMAFFVLILAFANFDDVSFKKMTGAVRDHFGFKVIDVMNEPAETTIIEMYSRPTSNPPGPQDTLEPAGDQGQDGTGPQEGGGDMGALQRAINDMLESGQVTVEHSGSEVVVKLPPTMTDPEAQAFAEALAGAAGTKAQEAADTGDADAQGGAEGQSPGQSSGAGAGGGSSEGVQPGSAPGGTGEGPQSGAETGSQSGSNGEGGARPEQRAAIAEAKLQVALREQVAQGLVDVETREDKVFVTVGAGGAFASGSADLTDQAREIMAGLALASRNGEARITVTGHTDNVPLNGSAFGDNWGLGAARASSVVRELTAQGQIDPSRMTAVSKGETSPVADNATEEGRARNRRIEIEIDFARP